MQKHHCREEKTGRENCKRKPDGKLRREFKMARISKKKTVEILDLLKEAYPEAGCALEHVNVYELIVCVVLSAQTTDASVNKVSPALFAAYPDAFALADASQEDVMDIIRTIGMYKTKSANVRKLSQMLVDEYGGVVPGDYDELVKLPGVGRKTANVVLAEAFGQQRIAVDTHVFRLANRIGFTAEKDVFATEDALMKAIPEDSWTKMHHALIWHGRRVCHARKPACEGCCLDGICKKNGL